MPRRVPGTLTLARGNTAALFYEAQLRLTYPPASTGFSVKIHGVLQCAAGWRAHRPSAIWGRWSSAACPCLTGATNFDDKVALLSG